MLSTGAFNALLKTLEEPTQNVVFILATTELHKIPATILSRVQRFEFKSIKTQDIKEHIHYILEKENISLNQRLWKSLPDGLKVGCGTPCLFWIKP